MYALCHLSRFIFKIRIYIHLNVVCFSFCLDFHCLRITNKKLKLFANNERITNKIPYSKISENCHFLGTNCHFCVKQLKNDPAFYFYCIFMWQSFEKCDILEENLVFCLNKTKLMGFSPKNTKNMGFWRTIVCHLFVCE